MAFDERNVEYPLMVCLMKEMSLLKQNSEVVDLDFVAEDFNNMNEDFNLTGMNVRCWCQVVLDGTI